MALQREQRAWQRMLSGRRLDILAPSPLDIEIEDIALGLSRVARWNGQTYGDHAYTVAQHSILVVDLLVAAVPAAPPGCRLAALLHDAPEYVTSDLITPFKNAVGDAYRKVEAAVSEAVHVAFGLPGRLPAQWRRAIDQADHVAAYVEAVSLAGFSEQEARAIFSVREPPPVSAMVPWGAMQARDEFLSTFEALVAATTHVTRKAPTLANQ
jgi:uncharacterized protein